MSDHEDEGAGQLVPIKEPDPDKQWALRIKAGLAALSLAQALAEGNVFALLMGLTIALDAWRCRRDVSND